MFQMKSPVKYYFNVGLVVPEALLVLIRVGDLSRRAGASGPSEVGQWTGTLAAHGRCRPAGEGVQATVQNLGYAGGGGVWG